MKRALSLFDVTNIVVGSVIGADIYIASAITAGMLGPFALVVWVVAGVLAIILALVLAACSSYVPTVGGPFAYVSEAFNDFWGFLAGWSLWIAELIALPVFAIAFTNYLGYLVHLNVLEQMLIKGLFLCTLTGVNVAGVKAAGRLNDVLTLLKLSPLFLLMVAGIGYLAFHPALVADRLTPFMPLGIGKFHNALVLIFWAYVGFELSTIPSTEVRDSQRTIPRAIAIGMIIVTLFYLMTNFVVIGLVPWEDLTKTKTPLVSAGVALLGSAGALMMSVGALVSVSGSDESDMLATARLSYAMAVDGLFPKAFAKVHPKLGTPYVAIILQGVLAFGVSIYSGIAELISFSVLNLSFTFLLTCLALLVLIRKRGLQRPGQRLLALTGMGICLYLLFSTTTFDKLVGGGLLAVGSVIYVIISPKVDIHDLKQSFISEAAMLERAAQKQEQFLARLLDMGRRLIQGPKG